MEAAFPLAALEREEDFALTVEVAIPLGVFGVAEMAPGVVVNALEPSETTLVARELVALDERDERLEVYPPEFLVELEFVTGLAQAIHEVEDAVVLFVPTVLSLTEGDVYGFVDEVLTTQTFAEVHDKPHGFDGVTRV